MGVLSPLIRVSCHLGYSVNFNLYYMYTYFMKLLWYFLFWLEYITLVRNDCKVAPMKRVRVSVERPDQAVTLYVGQGGPAR